MPISLLAGTCSHKGCKDRGISITSCQLHGESCLFNNKEKKGFQRIENLSSFIHQLLARNPQLSTSDQQALTTIVLDAGHGGKDDGCSGKNSKEKHLALKITLALGRTIEAAFPELKVIYTRKTDVFIPLYRRAAIANENQADLFISIHCNAMGEKLAYIRGTETFVMGLPSDNNFTANRENQSVYLEADYQQRYEGFDPNSNEGHIFSSIFQNAYLDRSIFLAEKIEKYVVQHSKRKSRGVRQDDFVVLRETTMPSILVETGFLTNAKDEVYLNSKQGQQNMASTIFLAFKEYKEDIEREANSFTTIPIIEEPIVFEEVLPEISSPTPPPAQPIEKEIIESEAPYRATEPPAIIAPPEAPIEQPSEVESQPAIESIEKEPSKTAPVLEEVPVEEEVAVLLEEKESIEDSNYPQKTVVAMKTEETLPIEVPPAIHFKIQIAASPTPLDMTIERWQQLKDIEVRQERRLYKYLVGEHTAYQQAAQHRILLTRKGFKGAFVVAYKENKRISLQTARALVKQEN